MKKQAFNPYLPSWEYVPDGEPYVFGDRVYVYVHTIIIMGMYFAWETMLDGLLLSMILETGGMKA